MERKSKNEKPHINSKQTNSWNIRHCANHEPYLAERPHNADTFPCKCQTKFDIVELEKAEKDGNQMKANQAHELVDGPLLRQILVQRDATIAVTTKIRVYHQKSHDRCDSSHQRAESMN